MVNHSYAFGSEHLGIYFSAYPCVGGKEGAMSWTTFTQKAKTNYQSVLKNNKALTDFTTITRILYYLIIKKTLDSKHVQHCKFGRMKYDSSC